MKKEEKHYTRTVVARAYIYFENVNLSFLYSRLSDIVHLFLNLLFWNVLVSYKLGDILDSRGDIVFVFGLQSYCASDRV